MVDFLFALIELFSHLLRFRSYEAKCVQLGCFRKGRPLCTQILPRQCRLRIRKLETTGYPMVKIAAFCVPSFWHNTGVWRTDRQTDGRTDGQICRSIYSACKASFAARCKNRQKIIDTVSVHDNCGGTNQILDTSQVNQLLCYWVPVYKWNVYCRFLYFPNLEFRMFLQWTLCRPNKMWLGSLLVVAESSFHQGKFLAACTQQCPNSDV